MGVPIGNHLGTSFPTVTVVCKHQKRLCCHLHCCECTSDLPSALDVQSVVDRKIARDNGIQSEMYANFSSLMERKAFPCQVLYPWMNWERGRVGISEFVCRILVPESGCQVLGTKILAPGSWCQDLGTKILVPGSRYQDFGYQTDRF